MNALNTALRHPRARRRLWPWLLAAAAVLALLTLAGLTAGLVSALQLGSNAGFDGWDVVINGEPWEGWQFHGPWGLEDGLGLVIGLVVATVVLLLVVPLTLVFGLVLPLLLGGLGVALALALTLGAVGLVVLLLGSPIWLLAFILWLVFRKRPQPMNRTAA